MKTTPQELYKILVGFVGDNVMDCTNTDCKACKLLNVCDDILNTSEELKDYDKTN